ncbi:hypothetical protein [Pedobacter gandavensis]|uniref:hypothetical protein n=1 Tax=Pedobacter gandavensis TaxID=2679963 RepID=UPI00292F5C46|nr:hypothetical protein [Pedobacter gandavensis]
MNNAVQILIVFLFSFGCLAYLYGIFKACWISLQKTPNVADMPIFLSSIITSIGAVLATNLGAVLGIAITNLTSEFTEAALLRPFAIFSDPSITTVQITACYIYILTLAGTSVVWAFKKFTTNPTEVVSTIPELTKTFLGVIVGVFAVILAKKN